MSRWMRTLLSLGVATSLAACGGESKPDPTPAPEPLKPTLFAASEGSLAAIELESGEQRSGEVPDLSGPVDLQVMEDATLLVNLSSRNEVLAVDGRTLRERTRFPSSSMGGERPMHSYVSPARNGKRYWLTLNDGVGNKPESSTALFVDATQDSPTYLEPVGEVRLGIGHHKASFSNTRERVVISNIADCENVLSVYDYSDVKNIQKVLTFSAGSLGLTCSLSAPLLPHGCATSKVSGHAYCNLTGSGTIVSVDLDATPPTAKVIPTGGRGGGYTQAHVDGRYLYSVQASPREGSATSPGAECQVGQLAVVDASTDSVVREVPLRYRGPDCVAKLSGTDEAKAEVSHLVMGQDGKTLYVTLGAFGDADAHVRQELVVDLSQPGAPAQRASIAVGPSNGNHADALSPDGRFLFVANTTDSNLSQIDTGNNTVVHTFSFFTAPRTMSLFSSESGPSEHVGPIH
jgi:DNA-binding beta-propeller fold protein YncE